MIGRNVDDFIYRQGQLDNGCIQLRPGVQSAFRSFHGLITNLIRGGWLSQVRRIAGNRDLLAHLARCRVCNLDALSVLEEAFNSSGLAHDVKRSRFAAVWADEQGEAP